MSRGVPSFICYERKLKECNGCKEILPFSDFSGSSLLGTPRSHCKKCRAIKTQNYTREKKIKTFPDLYYDCDNDDCCFIWLKSKGRVCPKCDDLKELVE